MPPETLLRTAMLPYLEKYNFVISAAGIRYGSVAYIAFGQGLLQRHSGRAETTKYPVEIEFGSDRWKLVHDASILVDSEICDQDAVRKILAKYLVGKKVIDIVVTGNESRIEFDSHTFLISEISYDPASGFLYSFQAENEPAWETVDGILLQT